ncbi:MAG: alpha/beta fold hydrolase [Deltaproteobacteria bacterium]|nr:alpha/beta fold hydrolase [Deltaproteobacteria bacterium]
MNRLLLLALVLTLAGCTAARIQQPERLPSFEGFAKTGDGWTLSMFRVPPQETGAAHQGQPVVLVHGTGTNRFTFMLEGSDLATYLSQEGFDVWVAELRGTRTSSPPDSATWAQGAWNVDSMASQDVPAILDHIKAATGREGVYWVGHSLGGLLGYAAVQTPLKSRIRGVITLGAPVAFTHGTDAVARMSTFPGIKAKRGRFPMRALSQLSKGGLGIAPDGQLVHLLMNADNLDVDAAAAFATQGTEDISTGLLQQYGGWFEGGRMKSADGSRDWLEGMATVDTPLLVLAGTVDQIAPAWSVRPAYDRAGSSDKTFMKLGRGWGQREEYGHADLLVGDWAFEEVFPTLRDWLAGRAGGAGGGVPSEAP